MFKEVASIKLDGSPVSMAAAPYAEEGALVLMHNNSIAEIIRDKVQKQTELKFDATVLVATKEEVWIGDKAGSLHVH